MSVRLGVNIDHVATLRQQRRERQPDPLYAALVAEAHGADSIVAHLREDRRHIQEDDVHRLKEALEIPLSLEMAATEAMERIALDLEPHRVCLVPEKRQELTTEGGLDAISHRTPLKKIIGRLAAKSIDVSLFINADADQIRCAKSLGAHAVELHTGSYALATGQHAERERAKLVAAGALAVKLRLRLHAGHGLSYRNAAAVAALPGMEELNIGFSIISRALFTGLGPAVREMKELLCAAS